MLVFQIARIDDCKVGFSQSLLGNFYEWKNLFFLLNFMDDLHFTGLALERSLLLSDYGASSSNLESRLGCSSYSMMAGSFCWLLF